MSNSGGEPTPKRAKRSGYQYGWQRSKCKQCGGARVCKHGTLLLTLVELCSGRYLGRESVVVAARTYHFSCKFQLQIHRYTA